MKGLKKIEVKDRPVKRLKLNVVKTGIRAGDDVYAKRIYVGALKYT